MTHAELHFKPAALARYGLPDIAYPVDVEEFQAALAGGGRLPLGLLLLGLQRKVSQGGDRQHYEPAMRRLAELLSPLPPET